MAKATAIRMRSGKEKSEDVREIDSIKIENDPDYSGWKKKENVHDQLKNGKTISVDISPNPKLEPVGTGSERYVRSTRNNTEKDNLLKLPKG